jgi:hypothetical protein
MPLTRDKIVAHDNERMVFRFTMLDNGKVVSCQISYAAMDELAGTHGTENSARQAQFLSLRDAIEQIASDLFDEESHLVGHVVRIFAKHIKRRPMPPPAQSLEPVASSRLIIAANETGIQEVLTPLPESGDGESQNAADSHENSKLDRGGRTNPQAFLRATLGRPHSLWTRGKSPRPAGWSRHDNLAFPVWCWPAHFRCQGQRP